MQNWKKTFSIIWGGQLFSQLSSSIVGYSVIFWLSIETKSASILANSTIAHLLPQLILGLFTGVFIDRWDKKKTIIFSDIFVAVCSLVISFLFFFGKTEISLIYILLALRSVGSAFHYPAFQASIPLLAPEKELLRISGINQVIFSISTISAPVLAAILILHFELSYILLFDLLGAIFAVVSLLFIKIPKIQQTENQLTSNIFREMKEGLKAIYSNKGLLFLFLYIILLYFFLMPIAALFPLMSLNHFNGETIHMSIVEIAWGVGNFVGGFILTLPKYKFKNKVFLINFLYIIIGLTFAISGLLSSSAFLFFVFLTFICGISGAIFSSTYTVIIQTNVAQSHLGRVFSIQNSLTLFPSLIGLLATGYIADNIGITNAFIISGISIIFVGIFSFLTPSLKNLN